MSDDKGISPKAKELMERKMKLVTQIRDLQHQLSRVHDEMAKEGAIKLMELCW